jgi:hypothetical protein
MNGPHAIVDWQTLGALDDLQWFDRFLFITRDINDQGRGHVYHAGHVASEAIDALFLIYLAGFHSEIEKKRLIERHVANVGQRLVTVGIYCCGNDPSEAPVTGDDVRRMANDQVNLLGVGVSSWRVMRPVDLEDTVRTQITQRIDWNGMSLSAHVVPEDPSASSTTSVLAETYSQIPRGAL